MLKILKSYDQNTRARKDLQRRSLSYWPQRPKRTWREKLSGAASFEIGELNKSWELLETLEFFETAVPRDASIIDLGCFASEILCVLHAAGYSRLSGIDLDARVRRMPFSRDIRYLRGDMRHTGLGSGTFSAVLAMSSIEHGLSVDPLLTEVSRLLKPGGFFIGSTDYWEPKIDTTGIRMFGMDWRIFSAAELRAFFDASARYGLHPVGKLEFDGDQDCIECAGKNYTFAWFALKKS